MLSTESSSGMWSPERACTVICIRRLGFHREADSTEDDRANGTTEVTYHLEAAAIDLA